MSGEESYLPLAEIGRRLQQACKDLESGAISVAQMDELLADIRSLEERVIVLQYKAMERIARGESSLGENVPAHGTLSFSFGPPEDLMPTEAQEAEVPLELRNQISLIDSIEELSAEEQAEIRRLRKLRAEEEKKRQVALPLEEETEGPAPGATETEPIPLDTDPTEEVRPTESGATEAIASSIEEPIRLSGIKKMPRIKIKPLEEKVDKPTSEYPAQGQEAQKNISPETELSSKDTQNEKENIESQAVDYPIVQTENTDSSDQHTSKAPDKAVDAPIEEPMTAGLATDKKSSINEEVQKTKKATLAQKLGGRPIESIAKALSVNVRLGVTKTLFKGDTDAATAFIDLLDSARDLSTAEGAFSKEAEAREWKETSAPYKKLVELISRRYAT